MKKKEQHLNLSTNADSIKKCETDNIAFEEFILYLQLLLGPEVC